MVFLSGLSLSQNKQIVVLIAIGYVNNFTPSGLEHRHQHKGSRVVILLQLHYAVADRRKSVDQK